MNRYHTDPAVQRLMDQARVERAAHLHYCLATGMRLLASLFVGKLRLLRVRSRVASRLARC
jgi:hypothetical protein